MKSFRIILALLLCATLIFSCAASAFAVDVTALTFLYLDRGDIVIGDGTVSGSGQYGEPITQPNPDGYCITMVGSDPSTHTITVTGGTNHIVLMSVSAKSGDPFSCPFLIENGAAADVFFTGSNTFAAGSGRAAIEVSPEASLTLGGDGTLTASSRGQAAIGGGSGADNGVIVINSGTINATCTYEAAGIGGGSSGSGGAITINGGTIVAAGGANAAGIGGGNGASSGIITINGGTVTATGGANGAGIGGGWYGQMDTVTINGGSVKATAGSGAAAVGAGRGLSSGKPVNDAGETVYPAVIDTAGLGGVVEVFTDGAANGILQKHPNDDRFYFWLPAGTHPVAAKMEDGTVRMYLLTVGGTGSVTQQTVPAPTAKNGASLGGDDVLRGITCGLTGVDAYLTLPQGFTLAYDNDLVGTGTAVKVMYGETEVYRYRALLYGDLNNDGWYDGEDAFLVLLMLWDLLTPANTDALVFEAADADFDGAVTEDDMHLLEQAGLLRAQIAQDGGGMQSDAYTTYLALIPQSGAQAQDTVEDEIPAAPQPGFLQKLVNFIKYVIKMLCKVDSFWTI